MAEEALKITITADNKQALAALQQTVKSLDGVEIASVKAGGKVVKMGKDFTGLSRVIQDLPYGFNAIANNLTNILPAAGALGLGISALVAGLQFAQLGFGNWTRGLVDAKKGADEFAQSLAKEKTELNSLFAIATNNNVAMKERLAAVKELRNNYGDYLKGYTDEAILAGKAADAHLKLGEALRIEAKAAAVRTMAQPLEQKLIENEIALQKLATQAIIDKRNALKGPVEVINAGPGVPSQRITPEQRAKGVMSEFRRDATSLIKSSMDTRAEIQKLYDTLEGVGVTKTGGGDGGKEKVSAFEQYLYNLNDYLQNATKSARDFIYVQSMLGKSLNDVDLISTGMLPIQQQGLKNVQLSTSANNTLNQTLNQQATILDMIKVKNQEAFAAGAAQYLSQQLDVLFTQMEQGVSIGSAIGNMFKGIAQDIANAAAKAAIFAGLMTILFPTQAAAAGGFKGMFKAMFKGSLGGFASGGTVSGPKSGYPVMLHGTEHIVRPDQMRSIIASASQMGGGNSRVVVEGIIRGNDIFLSQQRTGTFRSLTT